MSEDCPEELTATRPEGDPADARLELSDAVVDAVQAFSVEADGWSPVGPGVDTTGLYAATYLPAPVLISAAVTSSEVLVTAADGDGFATLSGATGPPFALCHFLRNAAAGGVEPTGEVRAWRPPATMLGPDANDVRLYEADGQEWVVFDPAHSGSQSGQRFALSEVEGHVLVVHTQDVGLIRHLALARDLFAFVRPGG